MNLPSNFVCTAEEYADIHNESLQDGLQELIEKIIMFQIGYFMSRRLNGGLGHIVDQYLDQVNTHLNEYEARTGSPFKANTFSEIDY